MPIIPRHCSYLKELSHQVTILQSSISNSRICWQDVDKETEKEGVEVDRSNLARIVTEPFGDPIPGKYVKIA